MQKQEFMSTRDIKREHNDGLEREGACVNICPAASPAREEREGGWGTLEKRARDGQNHSYDYLS